MIDETQMSLTPKERREEKAIRLIDNTMAVLDEKDKEINYIVLKMGRNSFSTNHKNIGMEGRSEIKAKIQTVRTVGIGKEKNLWIKAVLTEGSNHQPLAEPITIELNLYSPCNESEFEEKKRWK